MTSKAMRQGQQLEAILSAAEQCISESSLLDFKMASIASTAGVSMGTVYKHVPSKEDVLVALAAESFRHLYKGYSQILGFPISTPARFIALFLVSPEKLNRFEFSTHLEMMVTNQAVLERASATWGDQLMGADKAFTKMFRGVMAEACHTGEFSAETDETTEKLKAEMMIGLWSLCSGFQWVSYQKEAQNIASLEATEDSRVPVNHPIVMCAKQLLNSYPWKSQLTDSEIKQASELLEESGYR